MPLELSGDRGVTYPTWTTAARPSSPTLGQVGLNTTIGTLEMYNGSTWVVVGAQTAKTFGYNSIFGS
ncbi:MAG: hypothetical protein EBU90_24605 [Proteobacteria bacterium]|nr:hypothetical protein [Pseudomonadota bacterium]